MNSKSTLWQTLESQAQDSQQERIDTLFREDPQRFKKYSIRINNLLLDYSKNLINDRTMQTLLALAKSSEVELWREKMFSGEKINVTEQRAVLHTALRSMGEGSKVYVDDTNIMDEVSFELKKMENLTKSVHAGEWKGYSGKPIKDIVNIGIGGSNLGPQMVTEALSKYQQNDINVHYISNVDSQQIAQVLRPLNPEQVLFIVSSKTFTTKETLTNAKTARNWLLAYSFDESSVDKHFVAVTANQEAAIDFGIAPQNIYRMWDWVGGRFSLWSAIGLPIALHIGFDNFVELLKGARDMDTHFRNAPLEVNAPVILALVGIWNNTFLGSQAQAILPYNQCLHMFSAYLQQAEMESNGKSVNWEGEHVPYHTGGTIWGQLGINGQHAFYQFLHQGTSIVPADFIAAVENPTAAKGHQEYLMANLFAQTQALMTGISEEQVRKELNDKGLPQEAIDKLATHKVHQGNRPSNTLLMDKVSPRNLGALIALYEHKIFVQGIIWEICSFDQWGVELGKQLANDLLPQLDAANEVETQDSSTMGLIGFYKAMRQSIKKAP